MKLSVYKRQSIRMHITDFVSMNSENQSDNFVRTFVADLRNSQKKTYKITWDDLKILFDRSVDPVVFGMESIWGSKKKFDWLVYDISENIDDDFQNEDFVVHVADCIFENGTFAVLSIGGGGAKISRHAFLSFYNSEHSLRWMCQIVIDHMYEYKDYQSGTVQVRYNEQRGEHITSLYMKSNNEKPNEKRVGKNNVNEMVFNGNFEYEIYSPRRGSKSSYEGFEWDKDAKALWAGSFIEKRIKGVDVEKNFSVDQDFVGDFLSDVISFKEEINQSNPENRCSL